MKITAETKKDGQPDSGWMVTYKWIPASALNTVELPFGDGSPVSKMLPPGMYSLYAKKTVDGALKKTDAVPCSAFQEEETKCPIQVP